ncbi:hypothetical protein [Halomarina litorea]|uniref:hypothetical protein n=1 Tax=Halomarina litorea TaxID=2961595 RepID=UPI0020C35CD4|nr:hypothetical protein [Halomarina sp. BCD28]
MSTYRMHCSECGAEGMTENEATAHSLVMMHRDRVGHDEADYHLVTGEGVEA